MWALQKAIRFGSAPSYCFVTRAAPPEKVSAGPEPSSPGAAPGADASDCTVAAGTWSANGSQPFWEHSVRQASLTSHSLGDPFPPAYAATNRSSCFRRRLSSFVGRCASRVPSIRHRVLRWVRASLARLVARASAVSRTAAASAAAAAASGDNCALARLANSATIVDIAAVLSVATSFCHSSGSTRTCRILVPTTWTRCDTRGSIERRDARSKPIRCA